MDYQNSYRYWSFALLVGLLSTYSLQSWHNPALHHHDPCCTNANEAHLHASETPCSLCDFVFIYDLPSQGLRQLVLPKIQAFRADFFSISRPGDKPVVGYALRGPPAGSLLS